MIRPPVVAAFALAVAAVICGLGTSDAMPVYLRILAGVLAFGALAGASEVTRDDVIGWGFAAAVSGLLLLGVAALTTDLPGLDATPRSAGLVVVAAASTTTLGLAAARAHRTRRSRRETTTTGPYHPAHAVAPAGGGRRRDRGTARAGAHARGVRGAPGRQR